MRAKDLLHAAVANNARWCDAVCRTHGYTGEFTTRVWISARHALPFYPNAITLGPPAPAGPPEDGLCWAAVTSAGELAQWETAWAGGSPGPAPLFRPDLLAGPRDPGPDQPPRSSATLQLSRSVAGPPGRRLARW